MNESQLVSQICEGLLLRGYFVWRQNNIPVFNVQTQSFRKLPKYTPKGIADIVGLTPAGQFFCVECKVEHRKQSDNQKDFEINIKKNNGIYILATCWEDVDSCLDGVRKREIAKNNGYLR